MRCYYLFSEAIILEVTGRHAPRYLNARLTNDLSKLDVGATILAGALSPQGRTAALFNIYRREKENYWLTVDGGNKAEIIAALKQFIVADQVEVKDRSEDLIQLHLFGEDLAAVFSALGVPGRENQARFQEYQGGVVASRNRLKEAGFDFVIVRADLTALIQKLLNSGVKEVNAAEYHLLRLRGGRPAFPDELGDSLLLDAGFTDAVSFTKGCFVGQEVLAKVDAHGKTPRILKRVSFPGVLEIQPGVAVSLQAQDGSDLGSGKIRSVRADPVTNSTYCFIDFRNNEAVNDAVITISGVRGKVLL